MKLKTPLTESVIKRLKSGDSVLLNGIIYTARDAAHKKLAELLKAKKKLPFDLKGAVVYYTGPTPAMPGKVIGSAGPTTSYRMDAYSPLLIKCGLKGMVGKGRRSKEVKDALKKYCAVYFAAVGGAGALLSKCVKKSEVLAFDELGTEAIRRLEVKNFPAVVINDIYRNDLYDDAVKKWRRL